MDIHPDLTAVRGELARTDTKAGLLLTLAWAAVSAVLAAAALINPLPATALIGLGAVAAFLAGATWALLNAINPQLPKPGTGTGWAAHAYTTPAELAARTQADAERDQHAEYVHLSRLTDAKYRLVRRGVRLLKAALATGVILAVALAIIGAS
ncbi:Pycsar system effector family protein [Streptosporangium sp. NPDC004631]